MTSSQQPVPPVVPATLTDRISDEPGPERDPERDSDGTPVGRDDLRADVERSGGDPDDV
jgi:hypothetical protein